MIIVISIFKEDNTFSKTTNLPYVPPMNTDNDYYRQKILLLKCHFYVIVLLNLIDFLGELIRSSAKPCL